MNFLIFVLYFKCKKFKIYNYAKWDDHYYFIDDIVVMSNNHIEISCSQDLLATYKDYIGNVVFNCNVSSDNSEIATSVLSNNTIILYYSVVTGSGLIGSYSVRMKYGDNPLSPGIKYVEDKTYYIDMTHQPYCSPSSGTYNEVNWEMDVMAVT